MRTSLICTYINEQSQSRRSFLAALTCGAALPAVKVDVDVLNPAFKSMKQASQDIYRQLPPPVQAALPFLSVAFASSFVVYTIQAKRLSSEVSSTQSRQAEARNNGGSPIRADTRQLQHGLALDLNRYVCSTMVAKQRLHAAWQAVLLLHADDRLCSAASKEQPPDRPRGIPAGRTG